MSKEERAGERGQTEGPGASGGSFSAWPEAIPSERLLTPGPNPLQPPYSAGGSRGPRRGLHLFSARGSPSPDCQLQEGRGLGVVLFADAAPAQGGCSANLCRVTECREGRWWGWRQAAR